MESLLGFNKASPLKNFPNSKDNKAKQKFELLFSVFKQKWRSFDLKILKSRLKCTMENIYI